MGDHKLNVFENSRGWHTLSLAVRGLYIPNLEHVNTEPRLLQHIALLTSVNTKRQMCRGIKDHTRRRMK